MKLSKQILICTVLMTSCVKLNAFVTVGSTPDCDYNNLFPAYEAMDPVIRVTSEQVHANNFTIEKIKVFEGGYDSCEDAEAGVLGTNKSKWTGLNAFNNTVVVVDADQIILSTVIMENFEIYAGNNTTFAGAGGILVTGNSNLILNNSEVFDNQGNEGGGIRVDGPDAMVTISNTKIYNNSVTGSGGGVYCEGGGRFRMFEDSAINNNAAVQKGGGVMGNAGCQIEVESGDTFSENNINSGIFDNVASVGGGVYLQGGTDMFLTGDNTFPATIAENISTLTNGPGGGGVYLTGPGTTLNAQNTRIVYNQAVLHGGGIVVDDFAVFSMNQLESACLYDECSALSHNFVTNDFAEGGAGYISHVATATIAQTHITNNRSDLASLFLIQEVGQLKLESNLITDNGPFMAASALDLFSLDGSFGNGGNLDFFANTLSNNNSNEIFFLNGQTSQQTINIFNSIIWEQGSIFSTLGGINPAAQIDCNVVHEQQSLSGNIGYLVLADPRFRNSNGGDYRLLDDSDAVDMCDESFFSHLFNDINGIERGIDVGYVADEFGPFDAGSYSYFGQTPDVIFRSSFD